MSIEQQFKDMQERHQNEFDALVNSQIKNPFIAKGGVDFFESGISGKISLNVTNTPNASDVQNKRFVYSKTKEIAKRKERINAAVNELVEYQEAYGKGNHHIVKIDTELQTGCWADSSRKPFGFKDSESAQSILNQLTDNAKAFIKGEL